MGSTFYPSRSKRTNLSNIPNPVTASLDACLCISVIIWPEYYFLTLEAMRTRLITIILIGITIGFLLGMGVITFARAIIDGDDPKLPIAFTVFMLLLGGGLIWYVVKSDRPNNF